MVVCAAARRGRRVHRTPCRNSASGADPLEPGAEAHQRRRPCWARHDADRSASSPAGPSAAPTRKSGAPHGSIQPASRTKRDVRTSA
jgi:hypothetical protein